MTRTICKNCIWGHQCPVDGGCEHYDPLNDEGLEEEIILYNKTEYEYEWRSYVQLWTGNDKWGDVHDK